MLEARDLIHRAMEGIEQEDDWYSLGQIGQYLTTANPDFDTRTYGKRKAVGPGGKPQDAGGQARSGQPATGAGGWTEAGRRGLGAPPGPARPAPSGALPPAREGALPPEFFARMKNPAGDASDAAVAGEEGLHGLLGDAIDLGLGRVLLDAEEQP